MATIQRERRILDYKREAAAKSHSIRELAHNLRHHTPFSKGDTVYLPTKRTWVQVTYSDADRTVGRVRNADGSLGRSVRVPSEHVQVPHAMKTKKQREAYHREEVARVDAALADLRHRK